jgi:general secretion pathway protein J
MRSRGFTLVEVLVALLILAVLSGMAWRGIDGMARARSGSQQQLERSLRLNTVIAQWEQDLSAVYDSAEVPALAFDGATLRLSRATEGGVQIVAWSLRGTRWQRWTGPVVTRVAELQDSWLRSQQFQGNEPGQLRTLSGVAQWQVYFFRNNSWSNAQSTGDVALPAAGGPAPAPAAGQLIALPSGVRLVLSFAPGSGQSGSLIRDTLLLP